VCPPSDLRVDGPQERDAGAERKTGRRAPFQLAFDHKVLLCGADPVPRDSPTVSNLLSSLPVDAESF
jgi:hypothetical protein